MLGRFVSYTSRWNFHSYCETTTKLEEEIDGDGWKNVSLRGFFTLYSPVLSLVFSPSVLFSLSLLMKF